MIAVGLAIEALAIPLVIGGLVVTGAAGVALLWASIVVVLVGLVVTTVGVRRARPSRVGWRPPRPIGDA